jgi:hypothetical protein
LGADRIGTVSVDPLQLNADGGPTYPVLQFVVTLRLAPVANRQGLGVNVPAVKERNYTVFLVSGRLQFEGLGLIGKFMQGPMTLSTSFNSAQSFTIEVELDPYRVKRIEEARRGDAVFQIDMSWLALRHPEVDRGGWSRDVDGLDTAYTGLIRLQVPQSHWVTLLPKLGYDSVRIVEIPTLDRLVPGLLVGSLVELVAAQKDLSLGDCDGAVGHCRSAIERVVDALPCPPAANGRPPSFRDKTKNFLDVMGQLLTPDKRKGLEQIMNAMWQWSSVPQHPHMPGHFNRADAETIMLLTTSILSYTGRLLDAGKQP